MKFVNIILVISASQGFLFGFAILFSPYFKSQTNKYLGYSILILAFLMFNVYLDMLGIYGQYPKLLILYDIEWIFLFPVFFFLYILKSINHNLLENEKLFLLYTPFLFSVIINVIFNLEYVYRWYAYSWEYKELVYDWIFDIQEFGYYSFNFVIAIWAYSILKSKKYTDRQNSKWLKRLCVWEVLLVASWIIVDIVDMIFGVDYAIGISIICSGASLFIFWIVYNGVYTLKLTNAKKNIISIDDEGVKMKKLDVSISQHSFSKNNVYFQKLENLLQKECIYRNPNLNQEMIAETLNISSGYLSQIVNNLTKKNFTAYINSYRVKEVKDMILNTEFDKYSLLAIGLEAGFRSKTTFYTSFKKETGLTPNQFKTNQKKVLIF
ncbi:helix-turn-helix domain-containing protein [uncultured Aquimarina sp.]|uniref:helix-turn-helix domain-containing protein n=1 Tax=uncultured Aquimarina sp. TaxID=575652 RepID=UPI002610B477|nr:helix-turn-helix domain-containing protein [uncultured Aquimarina sp.]